MPKFFKKDKEDVKERMARLRSMKGKKNKPVEPVAEPVIDGGGVPACTIKIAKRLALAARMPPHQLVARWNISVIQSNAKIISIFTNRWIPPQSDRHHASQSVNPSTPNTEREPEAATTERDVTHETTTTMEIRQEALSGSVVA